MYYRINEVFCAQQGEGARVGTTNVFVRFAGCNLKCTIEQTDTSPGGFDCDTEFTSGRSVSSDALLWLMEKFTPSHFDMPIKWCVLTGGEPLLQYNAHLASGLRERKWKIAIETNGSIEVDPSLYDYMAVSPKIAEHCIRQLEADEVRYVRGLGQALPCTRIKADRYFISPAFCGTNLDAETINWCQKLIEEQPKGDKLWEMSIQIHKFEVTKR